MCSKKKPALKEWAPRTFVRLLETFDSVLYPKNGKRCSMLNDAIVPGEPPVNVACGRIFSGFAWGKNCGMPGNTAARSFDRRAASSNGLVCWCAQFTPTVNSPNSVGLNVCSTVFT